MKKLMAWAFLPALGLALSSSDVQAGATVNAATCLLLSGVESNVERFSNAIVNLGSDPILVTCPLEIDSQLAGTVNFRVSMVDNNAAVGQNVTCGGVVYTQDGTIIAQTSTTAMSSTATFDGAKSTTLNVSPQSPTYTYSIQCSIPGGGSSAIRTVRVF